MGCAGVKYASFTLPGVLIALLITFSQTRRVTHRLSLVYDYVIFLRPKVTSFTQMAFAAGTNLTAHQASGTKQ